MLTPMFSNAYLDVFFYYVPMRLCWNHTKQFFGENTESPWVPQTEYTVPTISSPPGGFATGTIADYMGIPVGVEFSATDEQAPIALPFRAYALCCNEFHRDQNLTDPLNIPLGDANQTGSNGSNFINDVANGGMPFKAAKYHDYFTSCLPSPQKASQPVTFPLISGQYAPVGTLAEKHATYFGNSSSVMTLKNLSNNSEHTLQMDIASPYAVKAPSDAATSQVLAPDNLYADLTTSVGSVTVNQLRLAFQLQRYYERLARQGSRMTEVIKGFFGVTSPDARLQRPEYLGGNRVPLNVHEITNTAQSEKDFLGDLGAKSVTTDVHADFQKSFTEWGYILGLCCVRYDKMYPQGLARMWKRKTKMSYYWPTFANLGEEAIFTDELCATSENMATADVFGYQEAWASYRYAGSANRVSGEMRPGVPNSLASWHLADFYETPPTLSDEWIREDKTNVDRVLAVTSENANQVFCDIYCKNIATRPMPLYSIPGLIDHH